MKTYPRKLTEKILSTVLEHITDGYMSSWVSSDGELVVKGWHDHHVDLIKGEEMDLNSIRHAVKAGWIPVGVVPKSEKDPQKGGVVKVVYGGELEKNRISDWIEQNPEWKLAPDAFL